jgi:hypothetical protein
VATVLFVLLALVAPLVMVTPFTTTLVTDVLPLPPIVMSVVLEVDVEVTVGVNPAAEGGPLIVTVLPEAVAE